MEKLETISFTLNQCEDKIYKYEDLLESFDNVEVLKEENFMVVYDTPERDGSWYKFYFFEWMSTSDNDMEFKEFAQVSGPSGCLRECRHTYFPDKGYLFYLERNKMEMFMNFLEIYYDLE